MRAYAHTPELSQPATAPKVKTNVLLGVTNITATPQKAARAISATEVNKAAI